MADFALTEFADVIARTADNYRFPLLPGEAALDAYQAWLAAGGVPDPAPPKTVLLSQDLMAQFTAADAAGIRAAVDGNAQFWLLWNALTTQKDPMPVGNPRFLAGWSALVQVLGQPRMDAIAAALGVAIAAG